MKRYLVMFVTVVALAAASYALTRGFVTRREEDPSAWMQREFKLTDQQLAAVEKLQADYEPICAEHCSLIMQANQRIAAAPNDPAVQAEVRRLEAVCFETTSRHLHAVAAQMDPEQGRRFLALMEPKISRREHNGPLSLK